MLLLICGNSIDIKGLNEKSNNIIKILSIMSFNNLEKIITSTGHCCPELLPDSNEFLSI